MVKNEPMQLDEMVVEEVEQAQALWDFGFLNKFLEPASPSDAARAMGIPANRAHHRARRHLALGLLREVKRENRKVYYQLVARSFRHRSALLPIADRDRYTGTTLGLLRERFLDAFERSDRLVSEGRIKWQVHCFDPDMALPLQGDVSDPPLAFPAHFQSRTLRLSPKQYEDLVRRIAEWLEETKPTDDADGHPCTITLLAMDDVLHNGVTHGTSLSTFLPDR